MRALGAENALFRVVFGSYAGSEVKIDGEPLLILRGEDILAI